MAMNAAFENSSAANADVIITHIGLVNGSGVELSSGGYARQAVTWTAEAAGVIRPNADLLFNLAAGDVAAGWRGYSALTVGTDYGGATFASPTTMGNPGVFTLQAAGTSIDFNAI